MGIHKQSFIKGTMILVAASICTRILGFVPRIVLPRVIGAEGVGLYQMGWPFLIVILTLITGGIPLAVAKLVAEAESEGDKRRVRRIFTLSLIITTSLGCLFTAACMLLASWISTHVLTDARVYPTLLFMSPIILVAGISSLYRGYFQGLHNMIPTATSQVMETAARIIAILILAYALLPYGVEYAAAGAMMGVLVGELCGLLTLFVHYRHSEAYYRSKRSTVDKLGKKHHTLRELLRISIPVTASKLVGSSAYFLESVLIIQCLAIAGITTSVATAQYGVLQGMIIPVLLLPNALTYSLSVALVPSLSDAAARKDMNLIHKRLHQSLRLALVVGGPFAVIMFVLANPLCYYLYNDAEIGRMLKMMAPIALFIYFQSPLNATLQVLDKPGTALINTFIGSMIKLAGIYWLASQPQFGIMGAIIAINVNIALVTFLHWNSVSRLLHFSMKLIDYAKVGAGMLCMGVACHLIMYEFTIGPPLFHFAASCIGGLLVYLLCVIAFKLIDSNDLRRIPWLPYKSK